MFDGVGVCARAGREVVVLGRVMGEEDSIKETCKTPHGASETRPGVGQRIIEGLEEAIAWTHGENDRVRVTVTNVPGVDLRKARRKKV